jgi:hypothetical protein
VTPARPDQHDDEEIPARHVEVVAVATGALLLGTVVFVLQPWSTEEPAGPPASAVTSSPPLSPVPVVSVTPAPPSSRPTSSPSSSRPPSRPVVRWRGTLTVRGLYDHTDLDRVPPRIAPDQLGADIVGDWLKTSIKAVPPARVAMLPVGGTRGLRACREAMAMGGTDQIDQVRTGNVLCARTSEGRIAQQRVTAATQLSTRPTVRLAVTVWDPPAPL